MKRLIKSVSLVLVFVMLATFCSCSAKPAETTASQTEPTTTTTEQETTTTTTTAETTTETTMEPTTTTTAAPQQYYTFKSIYSLMNSTVGLTIEAAEKKLSDYFDVILDCTSTSIVDGHENRFYDLNISVEGIPLNSLTISLGKKKKTKNKVNWLAFSDSGSDRDSVHANYITLFNKAKAIAGKPQFKTNKAPTEYAIFKLKKKKELGVGGYVNENGKGNVYINLTGTAYA